MTKSHVLLGVVLVALAVPSVGEASYVVYSDGGSYSQSSASTNYYGIMNGSTFSVLTGASITPSATTQMGNIAIFSSASVLNVFGGSVTGGTSTLANGYAGATAILVAGPTGSSTITGGTITGGAGSTGGTGLVLSQAGPTNISGGTITGGNSLLYEAQGGTGISYQGGSQLTISGGTFSGGSTTGPAPFAGDSLFDTGGGNVEISGGQFLTPIVTDFTQYNSRLDFFGTGLAYSNGTLTGTLNNGNTINQKVTVENFNNLNLVVSVNASGTEFSIVATPAAVPEPSSIALISLGLGGIALIARSRRG
jgi:hypothetical protein